MKLTSPYLTAALVASALSIAWLAFQNRGLRHDNAQLQQTIIRPETPVAADAIVPKTRAASDEKASSVSLAAPPGARPAAARSNEATNGNNFEVVRALWKDPQFRASSIDKTIVDLEARYGRFFLSLRPLGSERIEQIKTVLARQSVDAAFASLPTDSNETTAGTQQRLAAMEVLHQQQEAEIKAVMGDDVFERYRTAQYAEPYRATVANVANGMRAQGFEVNDAQQEKMLQAYATAMTETGKASRAMDPQNVAALSAADQHALHDRQIERMQLKLAHAMNGILEGAALDAFIATQVAREAQR